MSQRFFTHLKESEIREAFRGWKFSNHTVFSTYLIRPKTGLRKEGDPILKRIRRRIFRLLFFSLRYIYVYCRCWNRAACFHAYFGKIRRLFDLQVCVKSPPWSSGDLTSLQETRQRLEKVLQEEVFCVVVFGCHVWLLSAFCSTRNQ